MVLLTSLLAHRSVQRLIARDHFLLCSTITPGAPKCDNGCCRFTQLYFTVVYGSLTQHKWINSANSLLLKFLCCVSPDVMQLLGRLAHIVVTTSYMVSVSLVGGVGVEVCGLGQSCPWVGLGWVHYSKSRGLLKI